MPPSRRYSRVWSNLLIRLGNMGMEMKRRSDDLLEMHKALEKFAADLRVEGLDMAEYLVGLARLEIAEQIARRQREGSSSEATIL